MDGFKTVVQEHDDVPVKLLLEPFLDQLVTNLRQGPQIENMHRSVELDFMQHVLMDHVKVLPEETIHSLLVYLHAVILISPVLAT